MELDQKALFALLALKMAQRLIDQADADFASRLLVAAGLPGLHAGTDTRSGQVTATLAPEQAEALFADLHAWVGNLYPALHSLGPANLAYHAGQIINEYLAEGFESLQQAEIRSQRPQPTR